METVRSGARTALAVIVAVLLVGLLSFAVMTVAEKTGLTETAVVVTGIETSTFPPLPIGVEELQLTRVPDVTQPNPLLLKAARDEVLAGMLSVKLTSPEVGAVPMLLTVTGTILVTPIVRTGEGWPMAMIRSGATTAGVTVVVAVLLAGLLSLAAVSVADSTGLVPVATGRGVMGTCTVVLAPLVIVAEELQLTSVPEVTQPKPLLVNVAGTVTLAGTLRVKLTSPELGAVPILLTVIGTILVCPTTSAGDA